MPGKIPETAAIILKIFVILIGFILLFWAGLVYSEAWHRDVSYHINVIVLLFLTAMYSLPFRIIRLHLTFIVLYMFLTLTSFIFYITNSLGIYYNFNMNLYLLIERL